MRQSIYTRYCGPTNTRGSRVRVSTSGGAMTRFIAWDDALDVDENHTRAALQVARALGWRGEWHGGSSPDGRGYVYVLADATPSFTVPDDNNG